MLYEFSFNLSPVSHADATMFNKETGIAYTPKKKRAYQSACMAAFKAKKQYVYPIEGPLVAFWIFYMPRTKSYKGPPDQNLYHKYKPDFDGLVKVVQDLLQTGRVSHKSKQTKQRLGIIRDDCQITLGCAEKTYVKANQTPMIKLILWKPNKPPPLTRYLLQALLASEK